MSKIIVPVKHELLSTALLFWNNRTNTFNLRMGHITPIILDMAQVFGMRPSARCVDITYDWSSLSHLTTKSSGTSNSITSFEYNSSTFKRYGTSFTGFIHFAKNMFSLPSSTEDRAQEHMYSLLTG